MYYAGVQMIRVDWNTLIDLLAQPTSKSEVGPSLLVLQLVLVLMGIYLTLRILLSPGLDIITAHNIKTGLLIATALALNLISSRIALPRSPLAILRSGGWLFSAFLLGWALRLVVA